MGINCGFLLFYRGGETVIQRATSYQRHVKRKRAPHKLPNQDRHQTPTVLGAPRASLETKCQSRSHRVDIRPRVGSPTRHEPFHSAQTGRFRFERFPRVAALPRRGN